jgi:peptide/nickel transport system permease protein
MSVGFSTESAAGVVGVGAGAVTLADQRGIMRRVLRRPLGAVCTVYVAFVVGVAVIAPLALPGISRQHAGNLFATYQSPSAAHWLGTDSLGRDVLDRLVVGTQVTMLGVGEALLVMLVIGVPLGIVAGFFGGWIDRAVMWIVDLTFSIPSVVIIVMVLSIFTGSMLAGMVTLGILAAPGLTRVTRASALPVREELYVAAAEVAGLSRWYIVSRHVLPRILGPLLVQTSLLAAAALLVQTGLSFLGLLVQAPAPSWGGMVADGNTVLLLHPWLIWPPGVAITLTALAFGLLGDVIRDASVDRWSATPAVMTPGRATRPRRSTRVVESRSTWDHGSSEPDLLDVSALTVVYRGKPDEIKLVENVSFDVRRGETVGIVGETGCGKSITAAAMIGLLPGNAVIQSGNIWFGGRDLASANEKALRNVRGREIALIGQEPMQALDPAFRVGQQLAEVVRRHEAVSRSVAKRRVYELLESVRLADVGSVARRYPHELSGGMAQRVCIARAIAGEPKLLIADEPTTALDVTVQAELLELFRRLQREREMAVVLITHDWGVVADICDRAVVMYGGQVVEQASVGELFHSPAHPYTKALLASNPHGLSGVQELPTIPGSVPSPGAWPTGCRFRARCQYAVDECGAGPIEMARPIDGREVRCLRYVDVMGE